MKTYLTPYHPFACRTSLPLFTHRSAHVTLSKLARIKFEFVAFYHNVLGPEWSTNIPESDYRHKLHFFRSGSASLIHQGEEIELKPGYAYWEPSSVLTARRCDEGFEEFYLTFYCELIDGVDLFSNWPQSHPICVGIWDMDKLVPQWSQTPFSLNSLVHLQGQLYQWLSLYFGDLEPMVSHHALMFARYSRSLDLAESNLDASLRVADLARAHGTSAQAFSTAFTRDLGLSPKAYLNRRLNQKACELMTNTDWAVKEVAQKLAFSDERYFCRFFSKMNGVPPKKYRQMFYLHK